MRDFVTACTGGDWPGRAEQAQRLLDELPDEAPPGAGPRPAAAARPRTGVDKSMLPFAPPQHASQRERRAERNRDVGQLRIRVLRRARGRCEFRCASGDEPTDVHHVFGGADKVALESEYTMAAICEPCHERCNASPAWAREQGLAWARRMAVAAQAAGDAAAVAGFTDTAATLAAKCELAAAQARPLPSTTENGS